MFGSLILQSDFDIINVRVSPQKQHRVASGQNWFWVWNPIWKGAKRGNKQDEQ